MEEGQEAAGTACVVGFGLSAATQIRMASANANGEKNNTSTLHAAPGIAGWWGIRDQG